MRSSPSLSTCSARRSRRHHTDAHGVVEKGAGVSRMRALASRWFFAGVIAKPTRDEIAEADHHANGHADGHDANGHEVDESESAGQISH